MAGNATLRAARAAATGYMSLARRELAAALAEVPEHAPSLLVLACIELEEGNLRDAHEAIARLRTTAPESLEARLLESLLAHRQRALSSGWEQAFLEAWTELGRPDFQHSTLLPESDDLWPDAPETETSAWSSAASDSSRRLLALASPKLSGERARWLLQQVPLIAEPALLAAASDMLNHGSLEAGFRQEAAPMLRQQLARFSEDSSRFMQLPLQLLLVGTKSEAPFSAQELDALEALSVLPAWKETSFIETFQEARHRLREEGVPHVEQRAFQLAERSTGFGSALLLLRRAEATQERLSEDERRWMGRMLWRIGSRLTEASSAMEHTVGLLLMDSGAGYMNDTCGQQEAYKRQEELTASVVASYRAALSRWPLPSLLEEVETSRARNEFAWLRIWSGRHSLP